MAFGKKPSKKAVKQAEKSVGAAERAVQEFNKLAEYAGPLVSEGAREARDRAATLIAEYGPQVESRVRQAGSKASQGAHDLGDKARAYGQEASKKAKAKNADLRKQSAKLADDVAHRIGPRAETLRADLKDDYLPRAQRTAQATGTTLSAATAAALEAARKELGKGQVEIRKAATKPVKKKRGVGKVLLVLGLVTAGAAVGYVAWRKTRPIEDPWAPPADFARSHYPAAASTDSDSSAVSDSVGSADAGDVASALKADDTKGGQASVGTAPLASGAGASKGEAKSEGRPAKPTVDGNADAKVIDPAGDPKDNPADPRKASDRDAAKDNGEDKKGAHRA